MGNRVCRFGDELSASCGMIDSYGIWLLGFAGARPPEMVGCQPRPQVFSALLGKSATHRPHDALRPVSKSLCASIEPFSSQFLAV
jgi:hypothetical protein